MPALHTDASDRALIERARRGDRGAYGELWQRHAASARTVARSYSSLDADDLVAESFTKIYDAILAGGGPNGAFRPYLFTTIRNTAASWGRGRRETNLETLESFEDPATSESATLDALDRSTTAQAFRSLPTRWQEVLWYSEVEGMAPQQIAPLVGMSANATAALAYRAREGLRQAWIQAHLRNAVNEPECRWTIDRLGSYTRGKLRARDTAKVEGHLDDCAKCTIVAAEAREVGSRLALVLLPLTAGVGGATAYSAWLSQGSPAVDVALGAAGLPGVLVGAPGVSGGAAGGAAGSGSSGAGSSSAASGSAASGGAASGGAASGVLGAGGVAVGIGVGALVLVAATVSVVVALTGLTTSTDAPLAAAVAEADPAPLPEATAPILPEAVVPAPPVAPAPVPAPAPAPEAVDDTPVVDVELAPDAAAEPPAVSAPGPVPVPAPEPTPAPEPEPEPEPEPDPVDDVAPAPPDFTADTIGGLVDPLLTGTAEPGASITVTWSDGATDPVIARADGTWSVVANGLPAGKTELTATQTDAAGNISVASAPVTAELVSPALQLTLEDLLDRRATISGVRDSTVELLVDGIVEDSATIDDSGFAEVRLPRLSWLFHDLAVRYSMGGRTGPSATATFVAPG